MNTEATPSRDELATTYLHQLQALVREISVATDAIAANALQQLQDSVARQEMLCAGIAIMAHSVSNGLQSPEQPLSPAIDPVLQSKIQAARGAIRELNLKYAALLKHSGRSIALLASLCRGYTGQFQEARGPRLKQQTWSCEM